MTIHSQSYVACALGLAMGMGLVFYQVDTPGQQGCGVFKVFRKPVTAYVLRPPPAEVRYEACPQVTVLKKPEIINTTDERVNEPNVVEEKPRRRHRRHRRYWK